VIRGLGGGDAATAGAHVGGGGEDGAGGGRARRALLLHAPPRAQGRRPHRLLLVVRRRALINPRTPPPPRPAATASLRLDSIWEAWLSPVRGVELFLLCGDLLGLVGCFPPPLRCSCSLRSWGSPVLAFLGGMEEGWLLAVD
jgi:hypothetical protein